MVRVKLLTFGHLASIPPIEQVAHCIKLHCSNDRAHVRLCQLSHAHVPAETLDAKEGRDALDLPLEVEDQVLVAHPQNPLAQVAVRVLGAARPALVPAPEVPPLDAAAEEEPAELLPGAAEPVGGGAQDVVVVRHGRVPGVARHHQQPGAVLGAAPGGQVRRRVGLQAALPQEARAAVPGVEVLQRHPTLAEARLDPRGLHHGVADAPGAPAVEQVQHYGLAPRGAAPRVAHDHDIAVLQHEALAQAIQKHRAHVRQVHRPVVQQAAEGRRWGRGVRGPLPRVAEPPGRERGRLLLALRALAGVLALGVARLLRRLALAPGAAGGAGAAAAAAAAGGQRALLVLLGGEADRQVDGVAEREVHREVERKAGRPDVADGAVAASAARHRCLVERAGR
mmetsp:Transcript_35925/g.103251  ORF Transcript_35925/g.103251 Transcript_35925/m.103251 type:complete len:395 (-) Transcript_35925:381-1565(-)